MQIDECCEKRLESEKEQLDSFNEKDYEAQFTEKLTFDIEDYLAGKELEEKKRVIQNKVAANLKAKYFKDKLPRDLPFNIKRTLKGISPKLELIDEDEEIVAKERPFKSSRAVELSDEEMKKLQDKIRELQKRQTEIVELTLNKEKYLEKDNLNLMGSYVSEYKKLEGLKSNYIDRLQAAYCAETQNFDNHFCEAHPVDADHRF